MEHTYFPRIQQFTLSDLPDLDEVVLSALEFLSTQSLPPLDVQAHSRPLVIGSGNALEAGRLIFAETDAVYAHEGNYEEAISRSPLVDAFYVFSASGSKHAVHITERLGSMNRSLYLITNTVNASASEYVANECVHIYPRMREPYSYNTSTYLSMILGSSHESPLEIHKYIASVVIPCIPLNIGSFDSYVCIVPPEYSLHTPMFQTKFDELFGSEVYARVFTSEEIKHAKTVVTSDSECFISFGKENTTFGDAQNRIHIPLPDSGGPATILSIGYYVIGNIQRMKPPYFKSNIVEYTKQASQIFGSEILPIVE